MSDTAPGKRRADAEPQQEEGCRKRKDGAATSVTVELEVLDCPVCYEPLRPPIFQPHVTDLKFRCALSFNFRKGNLRHSQYSDFHVPSTTPSDGLPRDCFLFIVPKFYLDEDSKICVIIRKA